MSSKVKIIIGSLIVIGIFVVSLIILLFTSIFDFTDKSILKETEAIVTETKEKYDFTKPIEELHLGKLDNYVDYVTELSKQLRPIELRELVTIDTNYVAVYKRSYYGKQDTGKQIFLELQYACYKELLHRVTTPNSDWTGLPLTENFRNKYNEKESVSLQRNVNKYSKYSMNKFDLAKRKFAMAYYIMGQDENGYDDRREYFDWYNFVLDEEGYLDDVIFDHTEEIPRASYDE